MKVRIGGVTIGEGEPIAVQSMCNTKTTDIDGSIKQILELEECGCDIIRLSVPDKESAIALKSIISAVHIPVVADIHFDYKLAVMSADSGASKIRINPGNIGGSDKVKYLADYLNERDIPIRIGVNGGSLDKKYITLPLPQAMCDSAMEHVRLLEDANFHNIVISVKSSDVRQNIEAYKLLRAACAYPLHVGVTEAGVSERGIIKSAIGIGSLLLSGIGDTIRVSLSDAPKREVIVGHDILNCLNLGAPHVEVISCPTCARTNIDVAGLAQFVVDATRNIKKDVKISVMGCVVNGPGEASRCDFGVAGGVGRSAIFKDGKILKTIDNTELKSELLAFIYKI